ncbi:hypothetical protein ARMGADRAFT_533895 [Armillaria gallica]|uniref:Protein kinase domain-containing protein n=1 Tax=Armillaria gallica TaxID=47427 RepID=A0A2H3CUG0_ARMGA|nr:hypothetical protein ARMGADRAFT_533895 [Armillaria gallica]
MEHIDGKDFRILVPVQKAKNVCPAHKLAVINMALNLNLDAFVRGVYPLDFQPRNVILRNPGRRTVTKFARRMAARCAQRWIQTMFMECWSIWKMSGWGIR